MKHIFKIFLLLLTLYTFCPINIHAAIGDWKAYMSYHDVQEIEQAGNLIFVQASNSLYVYNKNDQSIQTFSKADYLSDCEIQHISYNKSTKKLLILYTNGNIDLMNINNYEVTNLPDYYNASIIGDKNVNDIYINDNFAYLSTGFGIVKINVKDSEVSDTYNLGFKVNWCEIDDNNIYAYSQTNGKYSADLFSSNLLDKNNWTKIGGYAAKTKIDKSELKQLVSTLNPGGPKYNYFWFMKYTQNQLYTSGGAFLSGVANKARPGTIQVLNNNEWSIFQDDINKKTGYEYSDINCVEPDINDPNHVFASGRTGLYEFENGKLINYYNKDNSILEGAVDGKNILGNNYVLVHTLLAEKDGTLWLLNSQAQHNSIIELTKDKQFITHNKKQLMSGDNSFPAMIGLFKDSNDLFWFVNDNSGEPAFICYQPTTDAINVYKKPFFNQDSSPLDFYFIRCIKEDYNHNIWIGTNIGPFYISREDIASNNTTLTQVKVPRNDGTNYADYLLSGVDITCMAIDKGNRKWFGTYQNGVYLISNDNLAQIKHFTSSNSPLLSDNIESIAINDNTGEVYLGTDKGLCSYMSDANTINTEINKDSIYAYPNPVKPDYTGFISIIGLPSLCDIKITTSNGSLVHQGQSNGGVYTWDGCDLKGKKVASGIYMVEIANENGEKGTVSKIAIIR